MSSRPAPGMVDLPCNHSVDATLERLLEILRDKGVTLFAVVDHSGEAEKAGFSLPPTKLVVFGNPKPEYLQKRHGFAAELMANVAAVADVAKAAAT